MKIQVIFFVSFFTVFSLPAQNLTEFHMTLDGLGRQYFLFTPDGLKPNEHYPLLIVIHGGGGNAKSMINFSGFNAIAQREKFFVVYPNGYKKGWHDSRESRKIESIRENIDDVKFIRAVIDSLCSQFPVDTQRIFSTGISNGAMMSLHLAWKLSDKIRAIAPICGSIAVNAETSFKPSLPVSILVINGTADPLVPYEGGAVLSERSDRGHVISTTKMMGIWMSLFQQTGKPEIHPMANNDPEDGCIAERLIFPCPSGNHIELIRIQGGGHTWPGGKQYLPKMMVGKVCRDFKAEEVIWDFFKQIPPR